MQLWRHAGEMGKAMLGWVIHNLGVGTLAVVFLLAAGHKVRDLPRFRASLAAYEIVPEGFASWSAPLLVGLELLTVAVLFLHEGRGLLLAFTLIGVYSLAIGINLLRGRTEIDCGCGDLPTPLSAWLLLRNLLLMALALAAGRHPVVQGSPMAWLVVAAGVTCLVGLYLIAEHLLANLPYVRGRYG